MIPMPRSPIRRHMELEMKVLTNQSKTLTRKELGTAILFFTFKILE
jgi:hypothetical protein